MVERLSIEAIGLYQDAFSRCIQCDDDADDDDDDDALQQSLYCDGDSDAPGGFNVIRWCFTTIFYKFVIDDSDNNSINQFAIDDIDKSVVSV